MGSFTHQDTGFNSSASSTSLAVTLSNPVTGGDLLVLFVQTAGASGVSLTDSAGNKWVNAYNGEIFYCLSSAASPGGLKITAAVTGGQYVHQMIADRFTPSGPVTYGGFANTGSSTTTGLNYSNSGCGDLGAVPAAALAWGAFCADSGAGDQQYKPGFQTASTTPADVIGSQFAGPNGTGLSVYVTNCVSEDATLTWYGTGTGAFGHGVSLYFTAAAAPVIGNFTHQDSAFNSSASSTSLAVRLSNAVTAGDLLVLFVQTAGGTTVTVTDSAGNRWANAYNGEIFYCLSSAAATTGLTITAAVTGGHYVHQMIADRFTPSGPVTYGGFANTGSSTSSGLHYNGTGCGDLGAVPAAALAWGAFCADSSVGNQSYTPGYQTATTTPPDVIGSQFAGPNGTGLSLYVTDCVSEDATLTWYGTGTGTFGHGASLYFTAAAAPATGNFTHQDTGIARSGGAATLSVPLRNPVSAGDLLVMMVESASTPTLSDSAGNKWTVIGPVGNYFYGAYVLSSAAAAGGVTVQAASSSGVHQVAADRFTPTGTAVFGGTASATPGSNGLSNSRTNSLGDLGTVPAGALAWGGFALDDTTGNEAYTAGFQSGVSGTANVIGSQAAGSTGTGFTAYAANCAHADAALTWYGTGHQAQGTAVSMYFTASSGGGTPPPPTGVFTHADSVTVQAASNVYVLSATLTKPVAAGDLLIAAGKSPDGSMTSANWSDSAGNTWTVAGGGNFLYLAYCLASKAAPNGLTVTVTTQNYSYHGISVDRFTMESGYHAAYGGFSDSLDLSSSALGLNYEYNSSPAGTISGVPAGSLAWMSFFTLGTGPVTYSGGYQAGSSGTPATLGSQDTENDNGGFCEYVLATDATGTVAMTWRGVGSGSGGWAVEGYFVPVATPGHLMVSFP